MGLTKEVRDFFTGRINRLLNEKLNTIEESIDENKVLNQCVTQLFSDIETSPALLKRLEQIEKEKSDLQAEAQEIEHLVAEKISKRYPKGIYRYASNFTAEVESFAKREFEQKALQELYPELVPQIAHIKHIKEDVESVVLLSTSETKLVQRLTQVLQKYGGDISELLEFIPE